MTQREDAKFIYGHAIRRSLPDSAVKEALCKFPKPCGKLILVAIGKAAWQMANAAYGELGDKIDGGIVITKYAHSHGAIGNLEIYEAGHPVPDEAGLRASARALELTNGLLPEDVVLFLVSGGGSALFEYVDFPLQDLSSLTNQMLASGASIEEMNTVRKHVSLVKGGRFAEHIYPARVFAIVLSDIISSRLDMIASGPTVADTSTCEEALAIVQKYNLTLTQKQKELLARETPKQIENAEHVVSGSVGELCRHAAEAAELCGYEARIVTDSMDMEARAAGEEIGSLAAELAQKKSTPGCLIFGGETVVHLRGNGKGGRNQELALAAAKYISGMQNVAVFSVGSDGTDGPTDAAGGYVDGDTYSLIKDYEQHLDNNNSYNALKEVDGLIVTGPTGTNVNDFAAILVK
ncbi:MAG: glycerate kinase [Clostridia bacterium]|nr:glycerate kinase [Clostridia bacterium]